MRRITRPKGFPSQRHARARAHLSGTGRSSLVCFVCLITLPCLFGLQDWQARTDFALMCFNMDTTTQHSFWPYSPSWALYTREVGGSGEHIYSDGLCTHGPGVPAVNGSSAASYQ